MLGPMKGPRRSGNGEKFQGPPGMASVCSSVSGNDTSSSRTYLPGLRCNNALGDLSMAPGPQ